MKSKKLWILVIAGLVLMVELVVQAGETKESSIPKITDRLSFIRGVLFARECQAQAQRLYENENILSGIRGVLVVVEEVNPQTQKYGLTSRTLKTDTELRLRQHGIRVVTKQEWERSRIDNIDNLNQQDEKFRQLLLDEFLLPKGENKDKSDSDEDFLQSMREYLQRREYPAIAMLSVSVLVIVDSEQRGLAYDINMQLMEGAELRRTQKFSPTGLVWQSGSIGTTPLSNFESVRDNVRDHVDKFINAYLAANPREGFRRSSSQRGLIKGIVSSEDGYGAMVGTVFVREGDTIGNIKIIKIDKDKVEFEKNGKRWTQGLNETPNPEWE